MRTLFNLPAVKVRRSRWQVFKRAGWWGGLLVAGVSLYALPFALSAAWVAYPLAPVSAPGGLARPVRGAYHVHSTRSDGRGSPAAIARAAKQAGLDFVVLTDHNLEKLPRPEWLEGILLVPGVELSTPFGHLTALGLPRGLTEAERSVTPVERVRAMGGAAFLSHPVQKKSPWTDWVAAERATGLELYSADSLFRAATSRPFLRLFPALFAHLGNAPHGLLSIVEKDEEVDKRLRVLASDHPAVVLCAHDAHGWPSYLSEFQTLSMYLPLARLPKDAVQAAHQVTQALASGESYCVFQALGDGTGFRLVGLPDGERVLRMGETVRVVLPPHTPPEVRIQVSGPARLLDDRTVEFTGMGAVQLEVWARVPWMLGNGGWRPWIVPSPIRVYLD